MTSLSNHLRHSAELAVVGCFPIIPPTGRQQFGL